MRCTKHCIHVRAIFDDVILKNMILGDANLTNVILGDVILSKQRGPVHLVINIKITVS